MALKLTVDSIDEVEEPLRPLYAEQNGKFHLAVDGLDAVAREAVATATKKANKEAQDLRHKMKPWETLGKTPEEIQTMLEEYTELQALKEQNAMTEAEKKGQWDQLKAQMNEKHAAQIKAKDELITSEQKKSHDLMGKVERHMIKAEALRAIAENKGISQLLLPFVIEHLRMGDDFTITVVDDKGEPKVNGAGDPLTPIEFVGEMRANEIFSRAFEGTGSSGSGMRPGGSGSGSPHPGITKKSDFKDEKTRSKFIDDHGLDAYNRLPWN